jgi:hypothetical protein
MTGKKTDTRGHTLHSYHAKMGAIGRPFIFYVTGSGKCFMTIQIGGVGICLPENSQAVLMQQILR